MKERERERERERWDGREADLGEKVVSMNAMEREREREGEREREKCGLSE